VKRATLTLICPDREEGIIGLDSLHFLAAMQFWDIPMSRTVIARFTTFNRTYRRSNTRERTGDGGGVVCIADDEYANGIGLAGKASAGVMAARSTWGWGSSGSWAAAMAASSE